VTARPELVLGMDGRTGARHKSNEYGIPSEKYDGRKISGTFAEENHRNSRPGKRK
jgi:hypothetical protein